MLHLKLKIKIAGTQWKFGQNWYFAAEAPNAFYTHFDSLPKYKAPLESWNPAQIYEKGGKLTLEAFEKNVEKLRDNCGKIDIGNVHISTGGT